MSKEALKAQSANNSNPKNAVGGGANRRTINSTTQPSNNASSQLNERKLASALTRAKNYTEDNFHTLARRSIAKAFGYDDLVREANSIEKEHDKAGYLTRELSDRRNAMETEMFSRIRKQYGENMVRRVKNSL